MQLTASYALNYASEVPSEAARLDTLNAALVEYFGGRLSNAPIELLDPTNILDLGCGSGAWAMAAATLFPEATVVGVDIKPVPTHVTFPPNFNFVPMDISAPFLFQQATFDVVHARLLLLHLPGVESILKRVSRLLKPGGILILEDPDDEDIDQDGNMRGLARSPLVSALHRVIRQGQANPCIGREHVRMLNELRCFSEVHSTRIGLPFTKTDDPWTRMEPSTLNLTKAWKETYKRITASLPALHRENGITAELASQFIKDLDNPEIDLVSVLVLTWARKSLA